MKIIKIITFILGLIIANNAIAESINYKLRKESPEVAEQKYMLKFGCDTRYSSGMSYRESWDENCQDLYGEYHMGSDHKKVKKLYFDFIDALKTRNKEKMASLMEYPGFFVNVDYSFDEMRTSIHYKNESEFINAYDFIFRQEMIDDILSYKYANGIDYPSGYPMMIGSVYTIAISLLCDNKNPEEKNCQEKFPYISYIKFRH